MKLRFEPDLDFRIDAMKSVCGPFRGQGAGRTVPAVASGPPADFHGVGNRPRRANFRGRQARARYGRVGGAERGRRG